MKKSIRPVHTMTMTCQKTYKISLLALAPISTYGFETQT